MNTSGAMYNLCIVIPVFGIAVNSVSLITLSKSIFRTSSTGRKILGIIVLQNILDVLACGAFILGIIDLKNYTSNCLIIQIANTRVLFWFFINYRGYLCAYNVLWQLTRIIYPFWSTPLNSTAGCTLLMFCATGLNVLQSFAFTRFHLPGETSCMEFYQWAGVFSFSLLCSTVFRYLFPLMIMFTTFSYLLEVIPDSEGSVYRVMRQEIRKTAFLDCWLYCALLLPHEAWLFLYVFANVSDPTELTPLCHILSLIVCCYPLLSALLGMTLRTANYMPLVNTIFQPTDHQPFKKLAPTWRTLTHVKKSTSKSGAQSFQ